MLVTIPLVFPTNPNVPFNEYKSLILHLGATILGVTLTLDLIRNYRVNTVRFIRISSTRYWLAEADRTMVIGIVMLVGSYLIATVLSPSPRLSFLGFNESYSGNSGYDVISLVVVFTSVVLRFRKLKHIYHLLTALAIVATVAAIYGVLQLHGWDAIGGRHEQSRIVSSFGNTLNLAGFLVVSIPVTLFLSLTTKRAVWWPILIGILIGVQLAALWFTGGRAALVSTAFSTLVLAFISIRHLDRLSAKRFAVTLLSGIVVSLIVVLIPSNSEGLTEQRLLNSATDLNDLLFTDDSTPSGGLHARRGIWEAAITSAVNPSLPASASSFVPKYARTFIGVGPDMFGAIFPISTKPILGLEQQFHPHNVILNIWVSAGLLGLISLAVFALGFSRISVTLVRRLKTSIDVDQRTVLALFVLVTLVSKFMEMQASVPRVSDLLPTMIVMGVLIAVVSSENEDTQDAHPQESHSAATIVTLTSAIALLVLIVTFIGFDLRRVSILQSVNSISKQDEIKREQYETLRTKAADIGNILLKVSEAHFIHSQELYDSGDLERAYDQAIEAWELMLIIESVNPYEANTQMALAKIASTQVERGDQSFANQSKDRYLKLASDFRGYPTLIGTAATAMATLGEYEEAIRLANSAISTEGATKPWAKAWYAKGVSEYSMGDVELGLNSLITATNKEPDSSVARLAHQALAKFYKDRGDEENARIHAIRAAE